MVAEINVLVAQAWIWNSLSEEEKAVNIVDDPQAAEETKGVDASQFKKFSRYAVEEITRRGHRGEAIEKSAILKLLVPKHSDIVSDHKAKVQVKAEADASGGDKGNSYAIYEQRAK